MGVVPPGVETRRDRCGAPPRDRRRVIAGTGGPVALIWRPVRQKSVARWRGVVRNPAVLTARRRGDGGQAGRVRYVAR
jgi:hypothetical protein